MRRHINPALVLAAFLAACGGERAGGGIATTDSAGVAIVRHGTAALEKAARWTIPDSALVSIGGADTGAMALVQVLGARRLPDGSVALIDFESGELRIFGPDGAHRRTIGRKGSGPGEFQAASIIPDLRSDTIALFDAQLRRLTRVAPDSGIVEERDLRVLPFLAFAGALGIAADGRILGVSLAVDTSRKGNDAYETPMYVVLVPADKVELDSVLQVPGFDSYTTEFEVQGRKIATPMRLGFGRLTSAAVLPDGFVVSTSHRPELDWYGLDGKLRRSSRFDLPRRAATAMLKEQQTAKDLEQLSQAQRMIPAPFRAQVEERVRQQRFADSLPWFEQVRRSADGLVWLQEFQSPDVDTRHFLVMDSTGALVARVEVPGGVQPLSIGKDHFVGLWRNEDDVEFVRVYPIRRGS